MTILQQMLPTNHIQTITVILRQAHIIHFIIQILHQLITTIAIQDHIIIEI